MKASIKANEVLDKIFMLGLLYVERFGLLEPEDTAYEAEEVDIEFESEEFQQLKVEHEKREVEKVEAIIDEEPN